MHSVYMNILLNAFVGERMRFFILVNLVVRLKKWCKLFAFLMLFVTPLLTSQPFVGLPKT